MGRDQGNNLLGHIHFDSSAARGSSTVSDFLALKERSDGVFRNKYVQIESQNGILFLGRIVDGPFFVPEEVGRESAFAQTAILRGEDFPAMPNYYVLARLEVLGELRDGRMFGTSTRPSPKSPVQDLAPREIENLVGLGGDMVLGALVGYPRVAVTMDSTKKVILPRNVGIFGTVGSGKTNSAQVLIEEVADAEYAVVVLDVEGEYTAMDEATTETHLTSKLRLSGREPRGIEDFHVYHPTGGEPTRSDSREFGIPFHAMSPHLVSELADLTEPQEGVFLRAHEALRERTQRRRGPSRQPRSRAIAFLEGDLDEEGGFTLQDLIDEIPNQGEHAASGTLWALTRKLLALRRTDIFDSGEPIDVNDLLVAGRVSVVDVSGLHNDSAKNIAIAWILRQVFQQKLSNPRAPRTLVVIEEAHTFISKESKDRMTATMDMLKLISRRGRKRWLALAFVSQQPSHLPDEIFELCNTRFIHSVKSEYNLNPLKRTSGDVLSELWDMVPALGPGQALITSPQFTHTVLIDMRPSATRRRMIE
jgi:DNA helicase HerA-like ATPase